MMLTDQELKVAKRAYDQQGYNAKKRTSRDGSPIEMRMTFEEWLKVWLDSGHWNQRGVGKGKYVMTRKEDLGHYELGNVEIRSAIENHCESAKRTAAAGKCFGGSRKGIPKSPESNKKRSEGQRRVPPATCEHCGKTGRKAGMVRHHFGNCKYRPQA